MGAVSSLRMSFRKTIGKGSEKLVDCRCLWARREENGRKEMEDFAIRARREVFRSRFVLRGG